MHVALRSTEEKHKHNYREEHRVAPIPGPLGSNALNDQMGKGNADRKGWVGCRCGVALNHAWKSIHVLMDRAGVESIGGEE